MDKFHEYCEHLEHEVADMMHEAMQSEQMHIDEIMVIGELIDQIKDMKKIKCMEKELDGDSRRGGNWDEK